MLLHCYKRALGILVKKPLRLWGLSLMAGLVGFLAYLFGIGILPVAIAFNYVISVGMSKVYLDGINGREVNSDQLFEGFSKPFRVAGGMAWADLWSLIWGICSVLAALAIDTIWVAFFYSLLSAFNAYKAISVFSGIGIFLAVVVALAGIIVTVIKIYSYKFVPYILATRPEVKATQALRLSMEMTKGKIGWMFLADLLPNVAFALVAALLSLLSMIPAVGAIFTVVNIVFSIVFALLLPIFRGLYGAAFFEVRKVASVDNYAAVDSTSADEANKTEA